MSLCGIILRTAFLSFFILNGYLRLASLEKNTHAFNEKYQKLEKTIKTKLNVELPNALRHNYFKVHSDTIVKAAAYLQIILAILGILGCQCSTTALGVFFFVREVLHQEVFTFSGKTSMIEFEKFALVVSLVTGAFVIGCCKSRCKLASGACSTNASAKTSVTSKKHN